MVLRVVVHARGVRLVLLVGDVVGIVPVQLVLGIDAPPLLLADLRSRRHELGRDRHRILEEDDDALVRALQIQHVGVDRDVTHGVVHQVQEETAPLVVQEARGTEHAALDTFDPQIRTLRHQDDDRERHRGLATAHVRLVAHGFLQHRFLGRRSVDDE